MLAKSNSIDKQTHNFYFKSYSENVRGAHDFEAERKFGAKNSFKPEKFCCRFGQSCQSQWKGLMLYFRDIISALIYFRFGWKGMKK